MTRYNVKDLQIAGFILIIFFLFMLIFWYRGRNIVFETKDNVCNGGRYGCCRLNKKKICADLNCSNC